ncbi:MAG: IMP cyclohydrolase [Clostridia bacterium]|nr:IMP cyclohydrolase [Clostridia bacterium]
MDTYQIRTVQELIKGNPYVGRGIVMGLTPDGTHAVAAYFIMGRSQNSRNRVFTVKDGEVFTEPFDLSKVQDPSLIIYRAVRMFANDLIVTNGDQTDTIYDWLKLGGDFASALATRRFEPDAPNFTPRISAMASFRGAGFTYQMSILKSIDEEGSDCARYTFAYPAKAGLGHFIHTYMTDGNPIPSFAGEPERMKMSDDMDAFTSELWDALDENNKISLYVRYTRLSDYSYTEKLINKNQ